MIGGTEVLKAQKRELETERGMIAERLQAMIDKNAKVAQSQESYIIQFDELSKQYQTLDEQVNEIEKTMPTLIQSYDTTKKTKKTKSPLAA